MEALIETTVQIAPILALAGIIAASGGVRVKWLLVAVGLIYFHDGLLTNIFGLMPHLFAGEWNWTGKLFALAGTLAIAMLPAFGLARSGITFRQIPGAWVGWLVTAVLAGLFLALALLTGDGKPDDLDTIAFQWTMPGLDEELFYRAVLLVCLNEAFVGRRRILGVDVGWGALLTSLLFGAIHGLGYDDGAVEWSTTSFLTTFVSGLILVWIRERTGSVVAPVLGHNVGNGLSTLF
jgi:uncharacterized protein